MVEPQPSKLMVRVRFPSLAHCVVSGDSSAISRDFLCVVAVMCRVFVPVFMCFWVASRVVGRWCAAAISTATGVLLVVV